MAYTKQEFRGRRMSAGELSRRWEEVLAVSPYFHQHEPLATDRHYQRVVAALLRRVAPNPSGWRVLKLDLFNEATGTGHSAFLQSRHARIVGVDIARTVVYQARKKIGPTLAATQGDVRALPFADRTFDMVFSLGTLEHVQEPDQPITLAEVRRVLKPDGLCVIGVNNRMSLWLTPLLFEILERTGFLRKYWSYEPTYMPRRLRALLESAGFQSIRVDGTLLFPKWLRAYDMWSSSRSGSLFAWANRAKNVAFQPLLWIVERLEAWGGLNHFADQTVVIGTAPDVAERSAEAQGVSLSERSASEPASVPAARRDLMEAESPAAREFVRRISRDLKGWERISNVRSAATLGSTVVLIIAVVALTRWAGQWWVTAAGCLAIAALQHRLNVIQHEAIHRLLFTNRRINDWLGVHLAGAAILTPHTYRLYHFKHHRELGRLSDPDHPGYTRFPATPWKVAGFVVENLLGVGVLTRFLAETRRAVSQLSGGRSYHERRGWIPALGAWSIVGFVQAGIAAIWLVTGGTVSEFALMWIFPEISLTRTLMAVRLMGEHTSRGEQWPDDVRFLVTLPCGLTERALFAPLGFNYHAEHHLFPWVPYHRLAALHRRLVAMPEYRQLVDVRPGYLHAVFHTCARRLLKPMS